MYDILIRRPLLIEVSSTLFPLPSIGPLPLMPSPGPLPLMLSPGPLPLMPPPTPMSHCPIGVDEAHSRLASQGPLRSVNYHLLPVK